MMVPTTKGALLALMVALLVAWQPAAAFDLFYVSVGNSRYQNASFDIPDANLSAREVARALRGASAVDGVTLVSEKDAYVTPQDIDDAVNEVISRAHQANQPLIIYYFIGHGRSEGSTIHHVSVTGNRQQMRSGDALYATMRLRETLSSSKIPYILLMDNCFWRESLNFVVPAGFFGASVVPGDSVTGLSSAIGEGLLGAINRIDDLPSGSTDDATVLPRIEIYAAAEQETTQTLPHPMSSRYAIGPLARRLLLLLDDASKTRATVSIPRFVARMQDRSFDPESVAGHIIKTIPDGAPILFQTGRSTDVDDTGEQRHGSAG